jgi:Tol biopolymer transport system component
MRKIVFLLACAGIPPVFGIHRILLNRIGPSGAELFIANADGSAERRLLPAPGFDYNAAFSPDGKWIVFTSERSGSADIYRVRVDGTGLERLTDDPACDDQGALPRTEGNWRLSPRAAPARTTSGSSTSRPASHAI